LEVSGVKDHALVAKMSESNLWHLQYEHLNVKGLKLLSDKNMVVGLLKIDGLDFCEGCIYGKQSRNSYPVNKAWRASNCLKLVNADVCGHC